MSIVRTLLVASARAFVSPAIAQTTGSEACTTITQSAANAATSRVSADAPTSQSRRASRTSLASTIFSKARV